MGSLDFTSERAHPIDSGTACERGFAFRINLKYAVV